MLNWFLQILVSQHLKFIIQNNTERKTGLEPATYSLGSCRSTR
jgi:hypothetical protein